MLYSPHPLQVGLPPAKNTKFVVTTWVLSSSECTKPVFGRGTALDPTGGAYDTPPDSWGGGHPLSISLPLDTEADLAVIPPSSIRNLHQCNYYCQHSLIFTLY